MVEAVVSGRVPEEEAIAEYNLRVSKRVDYFHRGVKLVYQGNKVFADQPFWQERYRYVEHEPLPMDLIRRLSVDPSARYFRGAFGNMDIPDEVVELFDRAEKRFRSDEDAVALIRQPDRWVPRFNPHVILRPALVKVSQRRAASVAPGHLVRGIELLNHGEEVYIGDPYAIRALQSVDGRHTLREIVNSVLATAPPNDRFTVHSWLMAAFIGAYRQGILMEQRSA
jgi:hypothetical protein